VNESNATAPRHGLRLPPRAAPGLLLVALAILSTGCGKKGPPLPPEPRGPLPPQLVRARQVGPLAEVRFDPPVPRGTKPKQQLGRAELLRVTYGPGVEAPTDPDAFRRRAELVDAVDGSPLPFTDRMALFDRTLENLPDGGVGYTLRYAVRIRDYRDRSSPLVVAEDLVPLPPAPPPQGLRAEPTADGVRLSWQAPAADEAYRYNVYRSIPGRLSAEVPLNSSPVSAVSFLDERVEIGESYVYTVRVSLADRQPFREGATSDVVEVLAEDRFPPAAPQGLVAVQEGAAVRLFWDPNRERDVAGYRVFRSVNSGPWEAVGAGLVVQPLYLDRDVQTGDRIVYRVTASDRTDPPNESEPSATVEVDLLQEPTAPPGSLP
jgi:hypothetical protein